MNFSSRLIKEIIKEKCSTIKDGTTQQKCSRTCFSGYTSPSHRLDLLHYTGSPVAPHHSNSYLCSSLFDNAQHTLSWHRSPLDGWYNDALLFPQKILFFFCCCVLSRHGTFEPHFIACFCGFYVIIVMHRCAKGHMGARCKQNALGHYTALFPQNRQQQQQRERKATKKWDEKVTFITWFLCFYCFVLFSQPRCL